MIKIEFLEPQDSDWQAWCSECRVARDALIQLVASGEKPSITDLYKDPRVRHVYKSEGPPFYGKCVYCESNILVNHPGDIDHWRPKNRVTDESGQVIQMSADDGTTAPHPGYYWLAYEWRNLLLACEDCNRPSSAKTQDRRIGKWDQFPVKSFRAVSVGDEVEEEPLLINPVADDPSNHLEIDETGVIVAKTDRGEMCKRIFGLNEREALLNARKECINNTKNALTLASMAAAAGDETQLRTHIAAFERIKEGAAAYSAAGRFVLCQGKSRLERFVGNL